MSLRGLSVALALGGLVLVAPQARAEFIITLQQVGSDVVATGSGTINLIGLSNPASQSDGGFIYPSNGILGVGPSNASSVEAYLGISGPSSFGNGSAAIASSGTGTEVSIAGFVDGLAVSSSYTSGTAITDSATWDSETLAGLGITPGTYTWTWGSEANADSLAVTTNAATPEPASFVLFASALVAAGFLGRRRRIQA